MPAFRLHILMLPVTAEPDKTWLALLDETELIRCRRILRPADRQAYAAAHALRRLALASAMGVAPNALHFQVSAQGAPQLLPHADMTLPSFSLSHTHNAVAVAVGPPGTIGVDIEENDRTEISDAMLRHGLGEKDAAALSPLPMPERVERFFDLWTVKEAVSKAEGLGRSLGFGHIHLAQPDHAVVSGATVRHWKIWRMRPDQRHFLALAAAFGTVEPEIQRLDVARLSAWCAEKSAMY